MKNILFFAFCTLIFGVLFAPILTSIAIVFIYGSSPEIDISKLFGVLNIFFALVMTILFLKHEHAFA
jgi:hypothetical protein